MLVIGVAGHELTAQERDWLQHDACAGVILFTRNFASRAQVIELTQSIRDAAPRPQLLCVDQEGGRVQRFRADYSPLPALEGFDALYRRDAASALALAREHAWLMASEIRATGLDLSFAPVVDLRAATGRSAIVRFARSGDRGQLHPRLHRGHAQCGHDRDHQAFPRSRSVLEDTHFDNAVDNRTLDDASARPGAVRGGS